MADDTFDRPYTPEELAALEADALRRPWAPDAELRRRFLATIAQQTARAEAAERARDTAREQVLTAVHERERFKNYYDEHVVTLYEGELVTTRAERDAARTALAAKTKEHDRLLGMHAEAFAINKKLHEALAAAEADRNKALAAQHFYEHELRLFETQPLWHRSEQPLPVPTQEAVGAILKARRDAETALAAAAVERARLVAALVGTASQRQFGPCWCNTAAGTYCVGQPQCEVATAALEAAASPHADLVAVRNFVEAVLRLRAHDWAADLREGLPPCTEMERLNECLAALPAWCREQP